MNTRTTFLFAQPSFLEGVARILDFGNTLNVYNESSSTAEADARALSADFCAVGDDIRLAMEQARLDDERLAYE